MSDGLWFFIAVGLYGLALPFLSQWARRDEQARLTRLEAKVDLLLKQFGNEQNMLTDDTGFRVGPPSDAVRSLLLAGKKINAIKAYREQNPGVGLKDAKDAVEAIESQLKAEN